MLSIAAAAIVTRVNSDKDLAGQIGGQFGASRTWIPVASILGLLGVLPGMPHLVILSAAAIAGFAAWKLRRIERRPPVIEQEVVAPVDPSKIGWDEVTDAMQVNIDIGYGLVPLVDERKGAPLMGRITGVRRQLSKELGFVVPQCRVRDDINLAPYTYRILVNGVVVGEDQATPDEMLALDTGQAFGDLSGKKAKDPTFGLDATWIAPGDADARDRRRLSGGRRRHGDGDSPQPSAGRQRRRSARPRRGPVVARRPQGARRAFGRRADPAAAVAVGADPGIARAARREHPAQGVPPHRRRDRHRGAQDAGRRRADRVDPPRTRPAHLIQKLCGVREPLRVMTLEGQLEGLLGQAARADAARRHVIEPDLGRRIVEALQRAAQPLIAEAKPFALVVQPAIRVAIRKLVRTCLPDTPVLSFFEVPEEKAVEVVAVIGAPQAVLA